VIIPLFNAAGTDALLSSFDSINVMRPPAITHPVSCLSEGSMDGHWLEWPGGRRCWSGADIPCHVPESEHDTRSKACDIAQSGCMLLQGRDRAKEPAASWWHTDQAPRRTGLHCIQGLLNITDVGPHAGDLCNCSIVKPLDAGTLGWATMKFCVPGFMLCM
jgi:hypothetical protein